MILAGGKQAFGRFSSLANSRAYGDSGKLSDLLNAWMTQKLETTKSKTRDGIWRRLAVGIVAAIVLYVVVSYVVVPIVAERMIHSALAEQTGLTATVGQVHFNPLETRLAISDFDLPDVDGATQLLGFDELVVDVRPLGFFGADVALDEVRLVNPHLSATIGEDGGFRLTQLLSGADEEPEPQESDEPESTDPLIIDIGAIHLEQGEVVFRDESRGEPFELILMPVTLEAHDFTTRIGDSVSFEFGLAIGERTELQWAGDLGFDPIRSSGRLELSGLDLRTPWQYLSNRLQFEVQQGGLTASARYEASLDPDLELRINEGSLDLEDVRLLDRRSGKSTAPGSDEDGFQEVIHLSSIGLKNVESVVEGAALISLDIEQASVSGGECGLHSRKMVSSP